MRVQVTAFQRILRDEFGVFCTVRQEMGQDISGAGSASCIMYPSPRQGVADRSLTSVGMAFLSCSDMLALDPGACGQLVVEQQQGGCGSAGQTKAADIEELGRRMNATAVA